MDKSSPLSNRAAKKVKDLGKIIIKEEASARYRQVAEILKIPSDDRTSVQNEILKFSPEVVRRCEQNKAKRELSKARLQESADSPEVLEEKCLQLAAAIQRANHLVVYTGAGISTAADIPDYRGPNGVWTLKDKGITTRTKDLCEAAPTYTHMALAQLTKLNKVKYIVSQNCDGLHVRSGVDRMKLSELHGNMFLEVCSKCKERREYMRLFDTTQRTGVRKHETGRKCHHCSSPLKDTIVHFGEKGAMDSPYMWEEAREAAECADMILCLGSSLKVLRKYLCLWCMDRPKSKRPPLYIVNLQWTCKDDSAKLKINGVCDDVMQKVMSVLNVSVPLYQRYYDPLFSLHTPLLGEEYPDINKKMLERGGPPNDHNYALPLKSIADTFDLKAPCIESLTQAELSSPGWYGLGLRSAKYKKKRKS